MEHIVKSTRYDKALGCAVDTTYCAIESVVAGSITRDEGSEPIMCWDCVNAKRNADA